MVEELPGKLIVPSPHTSWYWATYTLTFPWRRKKFWCSCNLCLVELCWFLFPVPTVFYIMNCHPLKILKKCTFRFILKSLLLLQELIYKCWFKSYQLGTSLVVQWLRLHTPKAGGPGQGSRSHILQLKILRAETKTQHSQINNKNK